MFQNMGGWQNRNPFMAGAQGRPSFDALRRLSSVQGVSPTEVPYSDEEMGFAFGGQVADAERRVADFGAGPRFRRDQGGFQRDPVLERERGRAIGGPANWTSFTEAIDRSERAGANRGFRTRTDLVGRGPGSGIGRLTAATGSAGPGGSFRQDGPAHDIETLVTDANNPLLDQPARQAAIRALQMLGFGGR